MDKLKKLTIYEILGNVPARTIRELKYIKSKRFFNYFLLRRREDLKNIRRLETRELILRKRSEIQQRLERQQRGGGKKESFEEIRALMLMFRSGVVDNSLNPIESFNIETETYEKALSKVKKLIKVNTDDIVNVRHSLKIINNALVPELVYRTDSKIKISKEELIKIIKLENKLRLSEESKKRNDEFFCLRFMSEIDQDFIEEALMFYGYKPQEDDSLKAYHLACGKYINDADIKELIVWMKYDKMRLCGLKLGEAPVVEGIELYNLDNKVIPIKSLMHESKPNLIICGSYS